MYGLAGKRIALVGGAGFIGHHLALRLADHGAEVHVMDGLTVNNLVQYTAMPPGSENRDLYLAILNQRFEKLRDGGIPLYVEDARDYHRLSGVLTRSSRRWSCTWPRSPMPGARTRTRCRTFGHSLRTLENSLDWPATSAERFVYFSSSMVYGDFRKPEVTEEQPLRADRHLRRAQVRRREDRDRLQPGVRPRLHDHPPVGSVRAGLREPAGEPDLHRERAGGREAAGGRRRGRADRLLVRRRRGGRDRPGDRRTRSAQRDLQHHGRAGRAPCRT